MEYIIREIRKEEFPLLEDFLFQALYVPEDYVGEVSWSIIFDDPRCFAAFDGYGSLPDDYGLVVEVDGQVVGACWARITEEYGHADDETPSISISLNKGFRGQGIGSDLLQCMLDDLRTAGYPRVSLSVDKRNPAQRLYKRLGFQIVGNGADNTEWLMVLPLKEPFTILTTERLILRPWLQVDAPELYSLASDPEIGPSAGWQPHASLEASQETIATVLAGSLIFAVVLRETGEIVGCAGFNSEDTASCALGKDELELGYWMGRSFWGQGFATEASRALLDHAFDTLGVQGIWAGYYEGNERSLRVQEKLGFSYVRTEPDKYVALLEEMRTEHFTYLSREQWERQRRRGCDLPVL